MTQKAALYHSLVLEAPACCEPLAMLKTLLWVSNMVAMVALFPSQPSALDSLEDVLLNVG